MGEHSTKTQGSLLKAQERSEKIATEVAQDDLHDQIAHILDTIKETDYTVLSGCCERMRYNLRLHESMLAGVDKALTAATSRNQEQEELLSNARARLEYPRDGVQRVPASIDEDLAAAIARNREQENLLFNARTSLRYATNGNRYIETEFDHFDSVVERRNRDNEGRSDPIVARELTELPVRQPLAPENEEPMDLLVLSQPSSRTSTHLENRNDCDAHDGRVDTILSRAGQTHDGLELRQTMSELSHPPVEDSQTAPASIKSRYHKIRAAAARAEAKLRYFDRFERRDPDDPERIARIAQFNALFSHDKQTNQQSVLDGQALSEEQGHTKETLLKSERANDKLLSARSSHREGRAKEEQQVLALKPSASRTTSSDQNSDMDPHGSMLTTAVRASPIGHQGTSAIRLRSTVTSIPLYAKTISRLRSFSNHQRLSDLPHWVGSSSADPRRLSDQPHWVGSSRVDRSLFSPRIPTSMPTSRTSNMPSPRTAVAQTLPSGPSSDDRHNKKRRHSLEQPRSTKRAKN